MSNNIKFVSAVAFSIGMLFSCSTAWSSHKDFAGGPCSGRYGNLLFAAITNTGTHNIVVFPVDGANPATDSQSDPYGFYFNSVDQQLWATTISSTTNGMVFWQWKYAHSDAYYFYSLATSDQNGNAGAPYIDEAYGSGNVGVRQNGHWEGDRVTDYSPITLAPKDSAYLEACGETGTVLGAAETGTAGEVFIDFQTMLNIPVLQYMALDSDVTDITESVLGPSSTGDNPSVGDLRSPNLTTPFLPFNLLDNFGATALSNSIEFAPGISEYISSTDATFASYSAAKVGVNLLGANALINRINGTPTSPQTQSYVDYIDLSNDSSAAANPNATNPYPATWAHSDKARDIYSGSTTPGLFSIIVNGQPGAHPYNSGEDADTGNMLPESDFAMIVQVNLNLDNDNVVPSSTVPGSLVPNSNPNGMFANSAPYGFGAGD